MTEVRPLTDDDVAIVNKLLSDHADMDIVNEIFNKYYRSVQRLISAGKTLLDDDDEMEQALLDRLRGIVKLAPPDEIFIRSYQKIWMTREQIKNRDVAWFLGQDYKHLVKKDHKQSMIEGILGCIRNKFPSIPAEEQEKFWLLIMDILIDVAKFVKLLDAAKAADVAANK